MGSIAALQIVVSSLALQSPFSATHLACLLTGVKCRYRTAFLIAGVTCMYMARMPSRWCQIFCLSGISTATSKCRFLIHSYGNKEFCSWSSIPSMTNRLAVDLFILLWLRLSWHYQMSQTEQWLPGPELYSGRKYVVLAAEQQGCSGPLAPSYGECAGSSAGTRTFLWAGVREMQFLSQRKVAK